MSTKRHLTRLRRYNTIALERNLEGMTAEDALAQPRAGGNCANWVLGHIVVHRDIMLRLLGGEPTLSEDESAPYARGAEPLTGPANALPFEKLRAGLATTGERLDARIAETSDEALSESAGGADDTRGDRLIGLQFHEAYHAGQIGILRRIAGKEAALK